MYFSAREYKGDFLYAIPTKKGEVPHQKSGTSFQFRSKKQRLLGDGHCIALARVS